MDKRAFFFIDDIIWLFRDLTRKSPASLFDHPFMKMLQDAHEQYGLQVQLNVFFSTHPSYGGESFTLDEMTDAYRAEWEDCSDWLKLSPHAAQEFPDYPYLNASYGQVAEDLERILGNVKRFAGEKSIAKALITHWFAISRDGCRAFRDAGYRLIATSRGDIVRYIPGSDMLAPQYVERMEENRKPETAVYARRGVSECLGYALAGYNHLTDAESAPMEGTVAAGYDAEMDVYFKFLEYGPVINDTIYSDLNRLEADFAPLLDKEFVIFLDHEQYFYPDYRAYQPNYAQRIQRACRLLTENGFRWILLEDIIPKA